MSDSSVFSCMFGVRTKATSEHHYGEMVVSLKINNLLMVMFVSFIIFINTFKVLVNFSLF